MDLEPVNVENKNTYDSAKKLAKDTKSKVNEKLEERKSKRYINKAEREQNNPERTERREKNRLDKIEKSNTKYAKNQASKSERAEEKRDNYSEKRERMSDRQTEKEDKRLKRKPLSERYKSSPSYKKTVKKYDKKQTARDVDAFNMKKYKTTDKREIARIDREEKKKYKKKK
jgi:hypothetical protein